MRIDWQQTHKRIVRKLDERKLPIKYDEPGLGVFNYSQKSYSDKTNPVEKIRQYYAETRRDDIAFCEGGYFVLRRWFPQTSQQMSLFSPPVIVRIDGDILESFEAGYDCANRWPYMKDYFRDSDSDHRRNTRREGALIEAHVRLHFQKNWPQFFKEASNKGQYKIPAIDDFSMVTPFVELTIDVKQESYKNQYGNGVAVVRNIKDKILYIVGRREENKVIISGFSSGRWCQKLADTSQALAHIESNHLWSIETLIVYLNMAQSGINYFDYIRRLDNGKSI